MNKKYFFSFSILVIISILLRCSAASINPDGAVLRKLWERWGKPEKYKILDTDDACEHKALECDDNGRVVSLSIQLARIDSLGSEIGLLGELTWLSIMVKAGLSVLPAEIGKLSKLQGLILTETNLEVLPSEVTLLASLTTFEFLEFKRSTTARTTGVDIPSGLFTLPNLSRVNIIDDIPLPLSLGNIADFQLTCPAAQQTEVPGAPIPQSWCGSPNLSELYINCFHIIGTLPKCLGEMKTLTSLYLHNGQLTGEIPIEIAASSTITTLGISSQQLTGSIPPKIFRPNLLGLALDGNKLKGSLPDTVGGAVLLTALRVERNYLTGTIPAGIGFCKNLTHVSLSENNFTGTLPKSLSGLAELASFEVRGNPLTGSVPKLWVHPNAYGGTVLTHLDLSYTLLSGEVPLPPYPDCLKAGYGKSRHCGTLRCSAQLHHACFTGAAKAEKWVKRSFCAVNVEYNAKVSCGKGDKAKKFWGKYNRCGGRNPECPSSSSQKSDDDEEKIQVKAKREENDDDEYKKEYQNGNEKDNEKTDAEIKVEIEEMDQIDNDEVIEFEENG